MTPEEILQNEIENILLNFAELREDVPTGDFQGIATSTARVIIGLIRNKEIG